MAISKQFVLAGDSTFTIEIPEAHRPSGKAPHYTFQVQKVEATERWPEAFFVRVLIGPNNESDYLYIGKLDAFLGQVVRTPKSALPASSYRFNLLNHTLARIWADDHQAYEQFGFQTHHEGCCGKCGRKLTTPKSIKEGIGPECLKKLQSA